MSKWNIKGQYMETCSCEFICPCITSNLSAEPSEGVCKAAIALHIDEGSKDGTDLAGISFVIVLESPGPMDQGNIRAGLIIDSGASDAQADAISQIATGAVGGPMEALVPLVGEVVGVERCSVSYEQDDMKATVKAGDLVDHVAEGIPSVSREGKPVMLTNTSHPVSPDLAIARATKSKFNVFGIDWSDATGTRNGHFSTFSWAN
ncbi:DUF1326 domain-containing protein [Aestuariispira ectoiniformans]|uniref:DUF1326 domain-containing protein n=1 Tax=Aestuariispira ectoiniformans TaxID=2775080 RepID=UPI00223B8E7D|nr:DUF1326 domain-containing protein [Aestuariispira ectoiniformans]